MTSARRREANRRNAQRSTGPTTANGKARVAQNAMTHGLLSRETLLPDEDPHALEMLAEAVRAELNPQGALEELFVEMMIRAQWRLRRAGHVEAGIFAWERASILADRAHREAERDEPGALSLLPDSAEQPAIMQPEKHQQAMADAERMRALGQEPTATLGLMFIRGSSGADTFAKLSRYETTIERSFYRAFHEFQRLKHARLGGYVPPPLAVDLTVTGGAEDDPGTATAPAVLDVSAGEDPLR